MSATGLEVFDHTLQTTNIWLDDLMVHLGWTDRRKAFHALGVVLHSLRDRIPVNSAAHLSAQLPMLIRGLFFEGWQPASAPLKERTVDQFLTHITEAFLFDTETDCRSIVRGVFHVLAKHISPGEIQKIQSVLPAGVREFWIE